MNGRVYDYRLGRFLSVDPIISNPANSQSINPYSYIGNNPLSGTDPTGYECVTQTGSHVCGGETIGNLTVNGTSNVVLSNAGKDAAKGNGAPGQRSTQGCKDGASCGGPSETGQKKEPGQSTTPDGGSTAPEAKKNPVDKKAAKAAYGETEGLKPRRGADGKIDPESKEDLTEARAAVAEISRRNKNVHSKDGSQAKDRDSKEAWKDSTEAAGRDAKLPKNVRHFFIRQDGVGRQAPDWSGDKAPFKSFGPFINSGGGDVPRGDNTYIDLYQGVK